MLAPVTYEQSKSKLNSGRGDTLVVEDQKYADVLPAVHNGFPMTIKGDAQAALAWGVKLTSSSSWPLW
jgi:hypothetical protein